jgi:hypothetical protein
MIAAFIAGTHVSDDPSNHSVGLDLEWEHHRALKIYKIRSWPYTLLGEGLVRKQRPSLSMQKR